MCYVRSGPTCLSFTNNRWFYRTSFTSVTRNKPDGRILMFYRHTLAAWLHSCLLISMFHLVCIPASWITCQLTRAPSAFPQNSVKMTPDKSVNSSSSWVVCWGVCCLVFCFGLFVRPYFPFLWSINCPLLCLTFFFCAVRTVILQLSRFPVQLISI